MFPDATYERVRKLFTEAELVNLTMAKVQGGAFESGHVRQVLHELIQPPSFALCRLQ
jgi:hypothetical protein